MLDVTRHPGHARRAVREAGISNSEIESACDSTDGAKGLVPGGHRPPSTATSGPPTAGVMPRPQIPQKRDPAGISPAQCGHRIALILAGSLRADAATIEAEHGVLRFRRCRVRWG